MKNQPNTILKAVYISALTLVIFMASFAPIYAQIRYTHYEPFNYDIYSRPAKTTSYHNPNPYPYPYPQPQPNFYVTCYANTTYSQSGQSVTWTAYATGGYGNYSYNWSGTDGLNGTSQSVYFSYYNPGQKYATVTVYSGGIAKTEACNNSVQVYSGYNYPPQYNYPYTPTYNYPTYNTPSYSYYGLDVGCYADPTNARINQPVNWSAEVTGGSGQYTYSWTGSDGLTGSDRSVIKYYTKAGTKSAIVTVTSSDGRSVSKACSNTLTVAGTVAKAAPRVAAPAPVVQNTQFVPAPIIVATTTVAAATGFGLGSVPWGWVAVLVILILLATVLYLIFNQDKI